MFRLYPRQIKPKSPGVGPRHQYFLKAPQLIPMSPKLRISCLNGGHMGICCISTFLDIWNFSLKTTFERAVKATAKQMLHAFPLPLGGNPTLFSAPFWAQHPSAAPFFPASQQTTHPSHVAYHLGSAEAWLGPTPALPWKCLLSPLFSLSWPQASEMLSQSLRASNLTPFSHLPGGHPLAHIHLSLLPPHSSSNEGSDSHFLIPCSLSEADHLPMCIHSLALTMASIPYHLGPQKAAWAPIPALLLFSCGILGKVRNSSVPQFPHL